MHEYGHAFHYVAVLPWDRSTCDVPGRHIYDQDDTFECSYVEGFADFLSFWVNGDRLITTWKGGDCGLENNVEGDGCVPPVINPPAGQDGARVEGAFAAFLYDLVDGDNEPDSPSNTPGPPEAWDNVTDPASWVLNVMQYCHPAILFPKVDGADALVQCLEGDDSAFAESQRWSTLWRDFSQLYYESPRPPFDKTAVRRLWKYNLYGVFE